MLFKFKKRLTLPEGNYRGYVKKGVPHGEGRIEFNGDNDAISFEGTFENGKYRNGIILYKDGSFFEGEIKDDNKWVGKYTFINGSYLVGTLFMKNRLYSKLDKKGVLLEAEGTIYYPNNNRFEGRFHPFEYEGTFYDNGSTFKGCFKIYVYNEETDEVIDTFFNIQTNFSKYENILKKIKHKFVIHLEGEATIDYHDGRHYEGLTLNSKPFGLGKMTYTNGDVYQGHFLYGVANGHGTLLQTNGSTIEGNFINGKVTGRAFFKSSSIEIDGLYLENSISDGYVKMTFVDGTKIQGIVLKKDENTPYTRIILDNGDIYKIAIKEGKLLEFAKISLDVNENDLVKMTINTEEGSYNGPTYNGLPHGYGKIVYPNGECYEGDFYQGQMHHYGKYTFSGGKVYRGTFALGKILGRGTFYHCDRAYYQGDVVDGKAHGLGKWWSEKHDKNCYEGHFINDEKWGFGHFYRWNYYYPYMGNYENGLEHGYVYVPNYLRSPNFNYGNEEVFIFEKGYVLLRIDSGGNNIHQKFLKVSGGSNFKPTHHNEQ